MQKHLRLNYIYEDSSDSKELPSLKADEDFLKKIKELPVEWIDAIKEAVELSDHDQICSLTTEIHNQHTFLADAFQQKIDQFDYDGILNILKKRQQAEGR